MFPEPQPTSLDLRFRLFGFPVRVHVLFWLTMALLGADFFRLGLDFGLIWLLMAFASILVHELGHALAIRYYGSPCDITLTAFGGYARPTYTPSSPYRRMAIALAGPAAGLLLYAVVELTRAAGPEKPPAYLAAILAILSVVNLYWSLMNLLPVWPLDGGRVCREACVIGNVRRPDQAALWVSVCMAAAVALFGLLVRSGAFGGPFLEQFLPGWLIPGPVGILFFALLAVQSYLTLQQLRRAGPWRADDRAPWER